MSLTGMPVLILNLGSEMVYILDQVTNFHRNTSFSLSRGCWGPHCPCSQRLRAQNIPKEKSCKGQQLIPLNMRVF